MESIHSGLIAAQLSQVESSGKGWLVPEGWYRGGRWPSLPSLKNVVERQRIGLSTQQMGLSARAILAAVWVFGFWGVFFDDCEELLKSVLERLSLTPDMDPGWNRIVWVLCERTWWLECWCRAPELWDVALCSGTTWTCLVSPKCQNCPGKFVCSAVAIKHSVNIPISWQISLRREQSKDIPCEIVQAMKNYLLLMSCILLQGMHPTFNMFTLMCFTLSFRTLAINGMKVF